MVTPRFVYSVYENRLQNKIKNENLPQHIGLIHDGHRRYARRRIFLHMKFLTGLEWFDLKSV